MDKQNALIIDDDVSVSNLLGIVLGFIGYECEIARSAKEALSRLAISNPVLVLLDMHLGSSLGGEDIIYQIRSNPRLKDARVIVITAHPSMVESVISLVDYTLIKPIDVEQLKTIIADLGKSETTSPRRDYFCDPMTGMYNQDFFHARLEHAIERAKRRQDFIFAVCVISVSLDQSSIQLSVNPSVFNTVLRDATQSLIHNLRPTDSIARLSYSKLATLHEELNSPEDINPIIKRIQTILTPPFRVDDRKYTLSFRIGKAASKDDYQRPEDYLFLAESDLETQ